MDEYYIERLIGAVDYLRKNSHKKITLGNVSEESGLSRFHFHRIFEAFTDESVYETFERVKIENAALLMHSRPSVSAAEIAQLAGYSNYSTFKNSFIYRFSQSPSLWRKEMKKISIREVENRILDYPLFSLTRKTEKNISPVSTEIKTVKDFRIAYIRSTGVKAGDSALFIYLYNKLTSWAASKDLLGPEYENIVIYHDPQDISPDADQKISIGISIPDDIDTGGDVGKMHLGGMDYLVCRYLLREDEYAEAWNQVYGKILPEQKVIPENSFSFELYPVNAENDDRSRNVVDIYIPVKQT